MTQSRTEAVSPAPFTSGPFTVIPEWIDENGHLNLAYYVLLFDRAADAFWQSIGLGEPLHREGFGTFAAETHTLYRAELREGETVTVVSRLLASDSKRLHVAHEMWRARDGVVSAQQELLYLCVDLTSRRVAPWPASVAPGIAMAATVSAPAWVGRRIAMPMRAEPSPTASIAAAPA